MVWRISSFKSILLKTDLLRGSWTARTEDCGRNRAYDIFSRAVWILQWHLNQTWGRCLYKPLARFISAKRKFKHRQKSSTYFGFASLSVSNSRSQVPEQSLDFRANVLLFLKTSVFRWGFSNSWFQKCFYHILSIPYGTNMYQPHLFSTSCEPVRTHDQPRFPPAPSSVEFGILFRDKHKQHVIVR